MKGKALFDAAQKKLSQRRTREAITLFHAAEQVGYAADECSGRRWICHMLEGAFELAWRESDSIALRRNPDPYGFWDGESLAEKRVLIRCLHGLGDTLQFIRYAPLVRRVARHVTIEAQPKLRALLAYSGLADEVISWGEPEPPWDKQVEVTELPRIFRTEIESIPNDIPYLKAPRLAFWPQTNVARVGVVWNASNYDPSRTIPATVIAELFTIPYVEWFSVQAGPERFEVDGTGIAVRHLYEEGQPMLETASILQGLDLVITSDTMTAHFAGALGQRVWTLLPFACDWRWMLAREDSPWYPTMKLLRQTEAGAWGPVLARVREKLVKDLVYVGNYGVLVADQEFAD